MCFQYIEVYRLQLLCSYLFLLLFLRKPLLSTIVLFTMSTFEQIGIAIPDHPLGFPYGKTASAAENVTPEPHHRRSRLHDALYRAQSLIQEWTPFFLVLSYFIFSTCLYMICDQSLIAIFWFIYLTTNFYIAGSTVVEAVMSMTPCREARKALRKVQQRNWVFPTSDEQLLVLDLVIVAYLPNEKDIIMDRILYAVEKIVYPTTKIRINIVYNTPKPIEPLESEMRTLTIEHPQLRIIKVPGSTSKADNLNYFLTLDTGADVIAIFDCDHYAHPYGPRWAIERFLSDKTIDIVQGRCVIFNSRASTLSAMIAVEFDKIYAVSHPGRAATWGFGLFTGMGTASIFHCYFLTVVQGATATGERHYFAS